MSSAREHDLAARYRYHRDGAQPAEGEVFVFGSNQAGRHGAGAAAAAVRLYGAGYGVGDGLWGRSYAIATKDRRIQTLQLEAVRANVVRFLNFARSRPDLSFFVTRVGCGLAGYRDADIAPLFSDAPENCSFAIEWKRYLEPAARPTPRARP